MTRLILASSSPARLDMLADAGLTVELHPHRVDERKVEAPVLKDGGGGRDVALALAAAKALDVSGAVPDAMVIGADQTLALDTGRLLTKPKTIADVRRQLGQLSGRVHVLHSAFALARGGALLIRQTRQARMMMRDLRPAEIDRYLERVGDAVIGSVGGYQIEGPGIQLFHNIEGDTFTVRGLPLLPLLNALRRFEALDP
jgi:septum formation protein